MTLPDDRRPLLFRTFARWLFCKSGRDESEQMRRINGLQNGGVGGLTGKGVCTKYWVAKGE
jgi:hypothetical protein